MSKRKTNKTASENKLTSDAAKAELIALVTHNAGLDEIVALFGKYGVSISQMSASRVFDRVNAAAERLVKRNASLAVVRKDAKERGITLTEAALEQAAIAVGDIIDGSASPDTEEGQKLILDGTSVLTGVRLTELREAEGKGKMAVKKKELDLAERKFRRETSKMILEAADDKRVKDIAAGSGSSDEKIEQIGKLIFGEDWK